MAELTGTLPGKGLSCMSEVWWFNVKENSLRGTLPEEGLWAWTSITMLWLLDNQLSGTIPEEGFKAMTALATVNTNRNSMTGQLPDEGMKRPELKVLSITENHHTGSVPCVLLERGCKAHDKNKFV
eukprot:918203-Amphidinium_carterae.1